MENNLLYQLLSLCAITKWFNLPLSSQIDSLPGQTSLRLLPRACPVQGLWSLWTWHPSLPTSTCCLITLGLPLACLSGLSLTPKAVLGNFPSTDPHPAPCLYIQKQTQFLSDSKPSLWIYLYLLWLLRIVFIILLEQVFKGFIHLGVFDWLF